MSFDISLSDIHIKRHLNSYQTIGIFSGSVFSKFICFDVDVKDKQLAKQTVYILVNSLQELGIDDEYIYISDSGNKGYHVEIFFNQPVRNTLLRQFYLLVMNYSVIKKNILLH